ncbi:MAG: hypothetical protein ABR524_12425 [Thermoanaerobaculia bacterium]
MADDVNETKKRIRFITVALAFMVGVGGYLVFKALTEGRFVLLVAILPMLLFSVPMAKTLIELRKSLARGTRGEG